MNPTTPMPERRPSPISGLTMIELMVGVFLVTVIFLAIWFNYGHQQEIWKRGRDKVLLQQACTQASEQIARDIRFGSRVEYNPPDDITIYRFDRELDADVLVRHYFLNSGTQQITMTGNRPVVPELCTALTFSPGPDTSEVRYTLTLKDPWENKATFRGSAFLRNIVLE